VSDYEYDYPPPPRGSRGALTAAVALGAALLVAGLGCAVARLIALAVW
jgi:hypothetical protein